MKINSYNFYSNDNVFEDLVGKILSIKKNNMDLNVYYNNDIIATFDLPKELINTFNFISEKRVLIDKQDEEIGEETSKYVLRLIRFVDIHRHSEYSLLDGASKIEKMADKTELFGAITDHGNIFGSLKYYKEMIKRNKRPIIGVEAYCESLDGQKDRNHLILLVKNKEGYRNLCKLLTLAEDNMYYKPHVSYELLERYSYGLIATSACLGGEVSRKLADNDYDAALEVVENFQGIFGDDYYLEIQNHGLEEEKIVNPGLKKLSRETGVKLVAAIDSHYINKEDKLAHEALLGISQGKTIHDNNRMIFDGEGYHIHTPDEFEELFKDIPTAISNLYEIAEKVNFDFELGTMYMPHFDIPKEFESEKSYFIHLCNEGFKKKFFGTKKYNNPEYHERLKHEINIITSMNYEGYFLIVSDFIRYAISEGIMVGPGRGSAAGSLVSYVLDIIDLDPIEHGLLFERFLNPDRVSLPDIDVDFQDNRRDEVLEYVKNKYGIHSTSGIITFGTFAAKSIIRDVAKYFGFSQIETDKLKDAIPDTPQIKLETAYETSPEFRKLIDNGNHNIKRVYEIAKELEGIPRHRSQHASGYVITDGSVSDYVPDILLEDKENKGHYNRVAAFNMNELEELGLLKMDFLGLRNMTVIGEALEYINKNTDFNFTQYNIDLYNPHIYKFIGTGNTTGIFQIESPGMKSLMQEMFFDKDEKIEALEKKYNCKGFLRVESANNKNIEPYLEEMRVLGREYFDRLVAAISLYRPGPMDYIPQYLEGMRDPESIHYDTPELKPILKATYGVIVYQEQVQEIARTLAGYSLGRGDLLRRAMGKKDMNIMEREKEIFINGSEKLDIPGCLNNGISYDAAITIWDKILEFANYAFNKSHSAGYAKIAAITAFLKHYFPLAFYNATLNSFIRKSNKSDDLKVILYDLKQNGINLKSPSVQYSKEYFTIEDNSIRFALKGLKHVGKNAKPIIEERELNGKFLDFKDFVYRMRYSIEKRSLESLIYSGTLDDFEETGTRLDKLNTMEDILSYAKSIRDFDNIDDLELEELFLFYKGLVNFDLKITGEELDDLELLFKEKDIAGSFITEHPLDKYERKIRNLDVIQINDLLGNEEDESEVQINEYLNTNVKIAGIPTLKKIFTKKNDLMFNGQIEDQTGTINVVIFPNNVKEDMVDLDKDLEQKVVIIEGKFQENDFGKQIIINKFNLIDDIDIKEEKAILIEVQDANKIQKLTSILDKNNGDIDVYIKTINGTFKYQNGIELTLEQELELREHFGEFRKSYK